MSKKPAHELYFSLPENWRTKTNEIFDEGGSDAECFISLGLTATEHDSLMKNPDYYEHFYNGMRRAEAFWLKWARENIGIPSNQVNTKLFETFMSRMFRWDRKESKKEEKNKKDRTKKDVEKFEKKFLKIAK